MQHDTYRRTILGISKRSNKIIPRCHYPKILAAFLEELLPILHLAPSKLPFLRSSHYGNGLCEVSRNCSETLKMNARTPFFFLTKFPLKFSQINLLPQVFDQASKETFGMPRKNSGKKSSRKFYDGNVLTSNEQVTRRIVTF